MDGSHTEKFHIPPETWPSGGLHNSKVKLIWQTIYFTCVAILVVGRQINYQIQQCAVLTNQPSVHYGLLLRVAFDSRPVMSPLKRVWRALGPDALLILLSPVPLDFDLLIFSTRLSWGCFEKMNYRLQSFCVSLSRLPSPVQTHLVPSGHRIHTSTWRANTQKQAPCTTHFTHAN